MVYQNFKANDFVLWANPTESHRVYIICRYLGPLTDGKHLVQRAEGGTQAVYDDELTWYAPASLSSLKQRFDEGEKVSRDTQADTANPKHAAGTAKLPIHLVPRSAIAAESLAFLEGYLKYGYVNWRATKVYASVYIAAMGRHLALFAEGENCDPKTGVPHLAYARACAGILIDAGAAGTLIDDRPIPGGYPELVGALTPLVAGLHSIFGHNTPTHHTTKTPNSGLTRSPANEPATSTDGTDTPPS